MFFWSFYLCCNKKHCFVKKWLHHLGHIKIFGPGPEIGMIQLWAQDTHVLISNGLNSASYGQFQSLLKFQNINHRIDLIQYISSNFSCSLRRTFKFKISSFFPLNRLRKIIYTFFLSVCMLCSSENSKWNWNEKQLNLHKTSPL